jgi:hypothetical protein
MYTLEDGSQIKAIPAKYTGWFLDNYGNKYWYQDGKYHRLDGPAWEEADGSKAWLQYGKLHRIDGPAREWAGGTKEWYQNDKLHRLDGPATEWADGTKEWWLDGKQITKATRIICLL